MVADTEFDAAIASATNDWLAETWLGEPIDVLAIHLDYDNAQGSPYFHVKVMCNEEDLAGAPLARGLSSSQTG